MSLLATTKRRLGILRFPGSGSYWERRYQRGGTSGAGSYGQIAQFKADYLNVVVSSRNIGSVIEFGCGDGAQLSLAQYPKYIGLDVAKRAIELCSSRFARDPSKSFFLYEPTCFVNRGALEGELGLSLDVILHLVEDEMLAKYLSDLFGASSRLVAIFTEDCISRDLAAHVRYRTVESWLHTVPAGWQVVERVKNPHFGVDSRANFLLFERR